MSSEETGPKQFGANRATVYDPEPPPENNPQTLPWQREPEEPEPSAKDPSETPDLDENPGADEANEGTEDPASEDDGTEEAEGGEEEQEEKEPEQDEEGTGEPEKVERPARRVRPDARTRMEIRFNEERAETATRERDQARADYERMKERFDRLKANPHEAEELEKQWADEDKAREQQPAPKADFSPTEDDKRWLRIAAVEQGANERSADVLIEQLMEHEPKLITAVRDLEAPIVMIEQLAALQQSDPEAYALVMSGSPTNIYRKLVAVEVEAANRRAAEAANEEPKAKAEEKPKPKPKAKKSAPKPPPDKPETGGSTPPPPAEDPNDGSYTDENGTVWVDVKKPIEKWGWSAVPRR